MRRVLMISPHFPPDTTAATHRVRLLAPHLPACGWQPTVLTIDPRDYEGRVDPELGALVPRDLEVVRSRAWPAAWTRRVGVGDLGLRSLSGLSRAASRLLTERRYDAVFVTIFPAYPALLGPRLKRRFGTAFVLDYQDPWVGRWGLDVGGGADGAPDFKSRLSRRLGEWLEPMALVHADGVTAVSAATYDAALARARLSTVPRCETLPIGWEASDMLAAGTRPNPLFDPRDGRIHLCYVGTFLPHGEPVLERFFGAVKTLKGREPALYDRLTIWFVGTSNQTAGTPVPRVTALARRIGVDAVVREQPLRVPYLDALRVLRDAGGILLAGSTETHYTASKLYPALLAQRPILAMFHERSTVVTILRQIGRPPSVQVIPFTEAPPSAECVYQGLLAIVRQTPVDRSALDMAAAEPYSARATASRLAGLLDGVTAPRAALARAV